MYTGGGVIAVSTMAFWSDFAWVFKSNHGSTTNYLQPRLTYTTFNLDLLWRRPCRLLLCPRSPHYGRHASPDLLRPLWSYALGSLQCDRRRPSQRQHREIEIFRRHSYTHDIRHCQHHGLLGKPRVDSGQSTVGNMGTRNDVRNASCCGAFCREWLCDG